LLLYGGVFGRFTGYWDKLDKIIDWHCAAGWLIRDSMDLKKDWLNEFQFAKFASFFLSFSFNVS
jgi:hypothetical protein